MDLVLPPRVQKNLHIRLDGVLAETEGQGNVSKWCGWVQHVMDWGPVQAVFLPPPPPVPAGIYSITPTPRYDNRQSC